jgi:WD40 repeat protein
VLSFDVTRDGSNFILGSAGEDLFHSTFDVTALELGTPRTFFTCNRGGFSTVRIRSDQRILATAGWDHRVRIFHTRKLQPLAILKYHTESVFGLDFSPDNSLLASVSKDRKLALWPIYPPSRDAAREVLRVY